MVTVTRNTRSLIISLAAHTDTDLSPRNEEVAVNEMSSTMENKALLSFLVHIHVVIICLKGIFFTLKKQV